jgi:hypothetical protein
MEAKMKTAALAFSVALIATPLEAKEVFSLVHLSSTSVPFRSNLFDVESIDSPNPAKRNDIGYIKFGQRSHEASIQIIFPHLIKKVQFHCDLDDVGHFLLPQFSYRDATGGWLKLKGAPGLVRQSAGHPTFDFDIEPSPNHSDVMVTLGTDRPISTSWNFRSCDIS